MRNKGCKTDCKTFPGTWQKPLCHSGFLTSVREPMKLTNAARTKAHVNGGDGRRNLEVILGHLPPPTAVLDSLGGEIERRPVLRHAVDVGWRRIEESRLVVGKVRVLRPRVAQRLRIDDVDRALGRFIGIAERRSLRRRCGRHSGSGGARGEQAAAGKGDIFLHHSLLI
jgi:hypothetical protein